MLHGTQEEENLPNAAPIFKTRFSIQGEGSGGQQPCQTVQNAARGRILRQFVENIIIACFFWNRKLTDCLVSWSGKSLAIGLQLPGSNKIGASIL